jgi:hypothetical protein
MATSGSTNYSTTATAIINGALRMVGALNQGDTASASQISEALEALNLLVKAYAAKGLSLWTTRETSVTPVLSTATYLIGNGQATDTAKPLKITQAYLHNSTTNVDTPMRVITRDEYTRLGNKESTGQPIQVWYEPLRDYGTLHVFPVPDAYTVANCVIRIINQKTFEDFDVVGDAPDFPQEWYEVLKYGLASRLAGEYGLDIQTRMMLKSEAKEMLDDALAFDQEEGSIYFQSDRRRFE